MTLSKLANLYIISRPLSHDYAKLILITAARFEAATGVVDIRKIDVEAIGRYLLWLRRFTASSHTQAGYIRRLYSLLRFAQECGYIRKLPPKPKIKCARRTPHAWGLDEFQRLYRVANCLQGRVGVQLARLWWPTLIAVAYHTGSRIGALLKVKWRDIDLKKGFIVLRAENSKTKSEQIFKLPDYVIAKIKELQWPKRELVWEWPHCRRHFFTTFRKKIARPANLEPLPGEHFGLFHKIRRTAASLAAAQAGIAAAQTLLGHTSAKTTIEHYVDPRIASGGSVILPSLE